MCEGVCECEGECEGECPGGKVREISREAHRRRGIILRSTSRNYVITRYSALVPV